MEKLCISSVRWFSCHRGTLSNAHQYDNDSIDTLTYHDVVKVAKGNFIGYYAIVFETGDLKGFAEDDETEINYLKKSFLK